MNCEAFEKRDFHLIWSHFVRSIHPIEQNCYVTPNRCDDSSSIYTKRRPPNQNSKKQHIDFQFHLTLHQTFETIYWFRLFQNAFQQSFRYLLCKGSSSSRRRNADNLAYRDTSLTSTISRKYPSKRLGNRR